jgi:hypothetical protein
MPFFDISTAVPIVKRNDGFYQKDEFDVSTAIPYDPLADQPTIEEAQKSAEQKMEGIVTDWVLSKKKELGIVKAAGMTYLTGGLYPVIEGVSGAIQNKDSKILLLILDRLLGKKYDYILKKYCK